MSKLQIDPAVQSLLKRLEAAFPPDLPVYLVGGAVRDLLLNRPTHDLDFVIPSGGIHHGRKAANWLGAEFYPLDSERDTGRIILKQAAPVSMKIDIASMRGQNLESDLRDRDFTINAMAMDLRQPERILDPLHGGRSLVEKVLRPCSPTSISNDPIRILRAVRLSIELGFKIEPETTRQIRSARSGLANVSTERVRDELFRILDGKSPATALRLLDLFGALAYILPEMGPLKGIDQPPPHTQDVWEHSLSVLARLQELLEALSPQLDPTEITSWALGMVSMRLGRYRQKIQEHLGARLNPERSLQGLLLLAALYHDAGKAETRQIGGNGKIIFYGHERSGAAIIEKRGELLHLSNLEIDRLKKIVLHHMRPLLLEQTGQQPTRRAVYRFFRDAGPAGVDVCLLSLADQMAAYGAAPPHDTWIRVVDTIQKLLSAWWDESEEKIFPPGLLDGNDLIQIFQLKPGPLIGKLLEQVREAQAAGEIQSREQALDYVRSQIHQG